MIRTALLALAAAALPVLGQTTKKPATTTKAAPTKTASTKTSSTKQATPPRQKTTLSGVYTLEDAAAGKEIYAGVCSSCHTTANLHNSPEFRKKWTGRTLSDLFNYMRSTMPKNDPGSLADEDYGIILSYMLQMNKMPPGKAYLSTDTLELRKIRFDTVRAARRP